MDPTKGFETLIIKSGLGGLIVVGLLGWVGHGLLSAYTDSSKLDQHTQQIEKLWEGQKATHDSLQELSVTVARIDGKIDVLGQKIDDDRAKAKK
jgi:hypothetical protein